MGNGLSPEFQKLLEDRKLTKIRPDKKLVLKEMSAAKSDLKDVKESIDRKKYNWANGRFVPKQVTTTRGGMP